MVKENKMSNFKAEGIFTEGYDFFDEHGDHGDHALSIIRRYVSSSEEGLLPLMEHRLKEEMYALLEHMGEIE
jgi:hypothetical protein